MSLLVEECSPNYPPSTRYRWVLDLRDGYASTREGAVKAIKRELEFRIRQRAKGTL